VYVDSVVYQQDALELSVNVHGADNALPCSDYPNLIGDMKGILGRVDQINGGIVRRVRGGNAQRIFGV
jgi:hypothetical protein